MNKKDILPHYQKAVDEIQDYFEYRYKNDKPKEIRDKVMTIIDNMVMKIYTRKDKDNV